MNARQISLLYREAHNLMRNIDGLQPQESFDELLKFLFYKEGCLGEDCLGFELSLTGDGAGRFTEDSEVLSGRIRQEFKQLLQHANPAVRAIWPEAKLRLSDTCLARVAQTLAGLDLRAVDLDVRSAALREFIPPEIRKGLGIYLTPDEVVKAAVEIMAPPPGAQVLDPACGAGTFLLEVARIWRTQRAGEFKVWGIDKNPRMLALAELNLGNVAGLNFQSFLRDSLYDLDRPDSQKWLNQFDVILTNPPFGVYVDPQVQSAVDFHTLRDSKGKSYSRQQSEVIFIEQCFRLLKPGGRLAIVLPRSVISNHGERISEARNYFGTQGFVEGVITLPPETFYATGTQANTVVLFARKYGSAAEVNEPVQIWGAEVSNCGYDSTGRVRPGSHLTTLAEDVTTFLQGGAPDGLCRWLGQETKRLSFTKLPELLSAHAAEDATSGVALRDLAHLMKTGRTPSRSAYTDSGLFLVKVGNLTGKGIDWSSRDRNFIPTEEATKRRKAGLLLEAGDILLTSSAHSPVYIAKKVDILEEVPAWAGGQASFVGEVMLIRPDKTKIDPFVLLAFLRAPETMTKIQRLVRGQTAHLHANDLGSISVPKSFLSPSPEVQAIADLLREENRIARLSNEMSCDISQRFAALQMI